MSAAPTLLKVLLRERHWQKHETFIGEYNEAAQRVDPSLVGYGPAQTQFHRWINGQVKSVPYPDHCPVLEAMFPGWTAQQLFEPAPAEQTPPGHSAVLEPRRRPGGNGAAPPAEISQADVNAGEDGRAPIATDSLLPISGALEYPADARQAGLLLQALIEHEPSAAETSADPGAWTKAVLAWLLARPQHITAPARAGIRVGQADVAALRSTTRLFMKLDFQFGGGHTRAALAQFFAQAVCPLLDGSFTEPVGRDLFSTAAEVAQLLGWTACDVGAHGLAQRYLIQALRLAQAAGDSMMGGRLLSNMSHQATYLGHPHEAVQLARAAQEGAKNATPTVMAMFHAMEARAHAAASDERACAQALREAERLFVPAPTRRGGP